jgi:hypothetical protein
MSAEAYDIVDRERFAAMSWEQQNDLLWRAGSCRHLMHSGQQALYDKYRAWEKVDQSADTQFVAGSFPRIYTLPIGKRWGKTSWALWLKAEDCIRRPGSKHRYTSAHQNSISEIINDVQQAVFEHAPRDVRPEYRGKKGAQGAGFYFPEQGPAAGSVIYLAGLDQNPDALRGQACDSDVLSEAAFIDHLLYVVKNVLYHQYQGRKHARMILESSAPKKLDTDWELVFVPDSQQRGASYSATIEDNPRLSQRDKDEFIAAAGGRGDPDCEREYFNVIAADPDENVVPEFCAEAHIAEHKRPNYGYTLTAADPGTRHLFGLVFGYWDFDAAKLVIQDSWAKRNASTRNVAVVTAAREFDLWGTWPSHKMRDIPLEGDQERQGWRDMLRGDRCEKLAEQLYDMVNTAPKDRADFAAHPRAFEQKLPVGHFTYYDGANFRVNPYMRVSDVDLRMIRDVSEEWGIEFAPTSKDDLREVMVNLVRNWIGDGRVVFLPECGPVADHVRVARWDKQRKKFAEHPIYGHFDCLAALIYLVRACELIRNRRPHPPARPIPGPGVMIVDDLPWQERPMQQQIQALNALMGRPGNPRRRHAQAPRRMR